MLSINRSTWLVLLAFFSIYVIWGTTFLAILFGLEGFPPFILSGLRFSLAGIILLGILYLKGERTSSLVSWKQNGISGLLILTVGVGAVTWSEQYISSSEAAIFTASEPFWFILLDKKNRAYYFNNKLAVAGLAIGFSGLILFFKDSFLATRSVEPLLGNTRNIAFIILMLSAIVWVIGSLYSRKSSGVSLFMNVAQQLIVGGAASLLIASFRGEWQQLEWRSVPWQSWLSLLYLVVFGSVLAYLSFIWLLSVKPAALVSTHTFVNPVVAVIAGWFVAGERITGGQLNGLLIILSGVIITNIVQYKLSKRTKVRIRQTSRILNRLGNPYRYITRYRV